MASITRDQFDETNRVEKKIQQKGVFLADADLNEQIDIDLNRQRRTLSALVGHANKRFGDGFKVVGTGASLEVTVKAGFAAFLLDTQSATVIRLADDATVSGFSAWTGARTDYVYLDILEAEVDATTEPNIVNPDIGEETCHDIRLTLTLAISEGAVPGSPPAGHTYISLASITKTSGSEIDADDVTVLIADHYVLADNSVDTEMLVNGAVEADKIAPGVIDDLALADGSVTTAKLDTKAVTTAKIDDDAVTGAQIADDALTSDHYGAGTIDAEHLSSACVTSAKIGPDAIQSGHITVDAILDIHITDAAVGNAQLGTGAVGYSNIQDGIVDRVKLNSGSVAGTGLYVDAVSALSVDGIVESNAQAEMKCKMLNIGDWVMSGGGGSKSVAHGLSSGNIRSVSVIIRNDDNDEYHPIDFYSISSNLTAGGVYITATNIVMSNEASGQFDSTDYDSTSFNRGWITIWYTV